jgi:hypothetical protein
MKFGAAFGIGFGAGFVGTFTGGAALTSVGASGISGGILAGIVSGAGGAAASSPIAGLGNYAVFGDQYSAGDFVRDVVFGSVLGGVTSGVVTRITCPGCNIWTGRPQLSPTLPQTARVEIPERTYAPDLKTESALPASAPTTAQSIIPKNLGAGSSGTTTVTNSVGSTPNTVSTAKVLPKQLHHFATNKHSAWTPKMQSIAREFHLDLDGAWNKAMLPHLGRHPNAYHQFVYDGMMKASAGAKGRQDLFLKLFDQYVKQPILKNPNLLRKSGW